MVRKTREELSGYHDDNIRNIKTYCFYLVIHTKKWQAKNNTGIILVLCAQNPMSFHVSWAEKLFENVLFCYGAKGHNQAGLV